MKPDFARGRDRPLRPSKLFGRVVLLVITAFFGLAALELWRRLRNEPIQLHAGWLLASGLAQSAAYTVLGLTFGRAMREAGGEVRPLDALEVFFRGQLAKYLPGKVGMPAVRMGAASTFKLSVGFMAGTAVLEALAALATAGIVAAVIAVGPWAPPSLRLALEGPYTLPLVAALLLGALGLAWVDLRRYPGFLRRILRSADRSGPLLSSSWLVGSLVYWVLVGLSCGLCALALSESLETACLAAAAGVLAPMVGFLAVVAPGGLGVREAFLTAALTPQIGATRALAFSLVSRAVGLCSELLLWLVARAVLSLREPSA